MGRASSVVSKRAHDFAAGTFYALTLEHLEIVGVIVVEVQTGNLAALAPVATIPKSAPLAPVSTLRTSCTWPPGFISIIRFCPLGSRVLPTTMLPLKSSAELIGPFRGGPEKTTRARDAQAPSNRFPLDLTVRQPA